MRVAVSGFRHGHIVSIVNQLRSHEDFSIVACCEEEPDQCRETMDKCDIEVQYRDLDEMLSSSEFEILACGDVYARRGKQVIKALDSGKHIFSDKPLCTSTEEFEEIKKLADEKSLSVIVALTLRGNPAVQTARKLILDGAIGEVTNGIVTGYHGLRYRSGRPGWYFEKGLHGGTINDLMVHGVDTVQWVTGKEITEIPSASTEHFQPQEVPFFQDVAVACFKLANGAVVFIDSSYKTPEGHSSPWTFHFSGTEGSLEFESGGNIVLRRHNEAEKEIEPGLLNSTNFVNDIAYEIEGQKQDDYSPLLTTGECLDATRKTLAAQEAADSCLANVKLT